MDDDPEAEGDAAKSSDAKIIESQMNLKDMLNDEAYYSDVRARTCLAWCPVLSGPVLSYPALPLARSAFKPHNSR